MRQSGLTSLAAAVGVASGLVLDVAIAASYGAGPSTDAFFVAARIPLGLVAILMVGANQVLVPAFTTWLARRGEAETWRLVSLLLTGTAAVGVASVAMASLAAWPLMRVTAPGLTESQVDLAASISRTMFLIVPLVAMAEVFRALLNARYSFVAPAAMHVVLNGLAAVIIVGFGDGDVHLIAWAYVAGAGAQVVFMLAMSYLRGFRYRASLAFRDPEAVRVTRLLRRPLAGAGLNPVARIGEQLFVSFLPPGSVTVLNYGYRLVSAIGGSVLFRSVIVALLPRLTEATAREHTKEARDLTLLGVKIMLAVSLPLTAAMAALARPASIAVFGRGSFSRADAALLGLTLAVYAGSLVGSAVQRAMLAPFYARMDTRTPLRNTFYGVVANLALVPVLVLPFGTGNERAILGVAAAYSIAQYVHVAHAWVRLREVTGFQLRGLLPVFVRLLLASAGAAAVMGVGYVLLDLGGVMPRWELLGRTTLAGLGGGILFLGVMALGGPSHLREIWASLRRRPAGR